MPSSAAGAALKHCFDPVIDERTRLLVLGSLPGEKSLALQEYYGNPQNRFWQLMSEILGVDLRALDYPRRLDTMLDHGVGLWDVIAQAKRRGSLDTHIRGQASNDLIGLLSSYPSLSAIAFNGGTAARIGLKALQEHADRYRIFHLPSSSPAHTIAYAQKIEAWRCLRQCLT